MEERFGLRFFDFPEHGVFLLNGRKLFLRGTQRHEDHAALGAAMTDELIRQEMRLVKDMGANFIRLGHYQQSRLVLDLCDQLGLLAWEEIPWCRGGVGGAQYQEQARRMLRNMIDQHRNHPAIVFWGLGNENDWPGDFKTFDPQGVRDLLTTLHRIAHEADPSRLTAIRRCPFAADIPDVYSPSVWAGWYSGRYTEYKQALAKEARQIKRMLHIEWGGDSHAGRRARHRPQLHELRQDHLCRRHAPNPTRPAPGLVTQSRTNPGTATLFPAHFAGIRGLYQGLPTGNAAQPPAAIRHVIDCTIYRIATRSGMRLHLTDYHLVMARRQSVA